MRTPLAFRLAAASEHIADKALAGGVGGMGLSGEQDLQAADLLGQPREALGIVEEQAGALVGGDAAGEAEGQHLGVELLAGPLVNLGEEALLGEFVAVGDLGRGDAIDGAEVIRCRAATRESPASSSVCIGSEIQVAAWTPLVMEWT